MRQAFNLQTSPVQELMSRESEPASSLSWVHPTCTELPPRRKQDAKDLRVLLACNHATLMGRRFPPERCPRRKLRQSILQMLGPRSCQGYPSLGWATFESYVTTCTLQHHSTAVKLRLYCREASTAILTQFAAG